jgi:hypothetical protein
VDVRVVLVTGGAGDTLGAAVARGARLGAQEAARTAQMVGAGFSLSAIDADSAGRLPRAPEMEAAQIIISTLPATSLASLRAAHLDKLIFDVTPADRTPRCDPRTLHLSPLITGARAKLWDAALERFGAQQLNERYTRATGEPMGDGAWLGWFATKVALELALRAHTTAVDSLAIFARSARARFDGQKGRPLYFDNASGFLVQPAYSHATSGGPAEVTEPAESPACRARAP